MDETYKDHLNKLSAQHYAELVQGDWGKVAMDEELRKITIEKCPTMRTKFFMNGKAYRITQPKLIEIFDLTDVEMNKLHIGYCIERKYPKTKCDEIYKELERLNKITII